MLSLENANMPATTNTSRPNRTSGRRVRTNCSTPRSKFVPQFDVMGFAAWSKISQRDVVASILAHFDELPARLTAKAGRARQGILGMVLANTSTEIAKILGVTK